MSDNKYLNLSGLSTLLAKLKEIFATSTQGEHADTAYEHSQSPHAPSNAERNVVIGIQKNGTDITPNSSRKVNITVPTKVSELANDSGYKTTDSNTTYSLSKSGSTITLKGSDGSSTSVTDSNVTVDSSLNSSSLNPVQNKVINSALAGKVPTSRTINGRALSTNISLSASDVSAIPASQKGSSNGVAELDSTGKVPSAQLPSFVDDVIEGYLSNGKFYKESAHTNVIASESGKIYVDLSTNKSYRWSGSTYVEISASLTLGETSATAYRGDRGKIAYDHSQQAHAPSNAEANVQSDWAVSDTGSDAYIKNKPTSLPANGGNSATVNGHTVQSNVPANAVFTDTNTWIAFKGATTSAAGTAGYAPAPSAGAANRYLRSDGTWAVPPDTNTTYSNMTAATASAAGKAGLVPAPSAGAQAKYLRGDGTWQTPTNTTYNNATTSVAGLMSASDKSKLDGIASGANKYTLPTASSSTLGGVKTTSTVTSTSGLTACPIISGVPYYKDTNTTYTLSSFGITATAAEINFVDGVTTPIQTQLNRKANISHNHDASNITTGTLSISRGGTGGITVASARTNLGATNIICQANEPTQPNQLEGDIWLKEV